MPAYIRSQVVQNTSSTPVLIYVFDRHATSSVLCSQISNLSQVPLWKYHFYCNFNLKVVWLLHYCIIASIFIGNLDIMNIQVGAQYNRYRHGHFRYLDKRSYSRLLFKVSEATAPESTACKLLISGTF